MVEVRKFKLDGVTVKIYPGVDDYMLKGLCGARDILGEIPSNCISAINLKPDTVVDRKGYTLGDCITASGRLSEINLFVGSITETWGPYASNVQSVALHEIGHAVEHKLRLEGFLEDEVNTPYSIPPLRKREEFAINFVDDAMQKSCDRSSRSHNTRSRTG